MEFDPDKNEKNHKNHGLRFEDAEKVFNGPTVTFLDTREDYGEDRYITFGTLDGIVICVAHTDRGDATRIISMRKATKPEREAYLRHVYG